MASYDKEGFVVALEIEIEIEMDGDRDRERTHELTGLLGSVGCETAKMEGNVLA